MKVDEKTLDELFNKLKLEDERVDYIKLTNPTIIYIPKKSEYNITKYVSRKLLKEIDIDIDIAIEKCLIVISQLTSTIYSSKDSKCLNSVILHNLTKMNNNNNKYVYNKIIDILILGTNNGPFIELINEYSHSNYGKSREYKLSDSYKKGLMKYEVKTEYIRKRLYKQHYQNLYEITENPIAKNLLKLYTMIEIPTKEEVLLYGKKLVKQKHITKKRKILTIRNKNSNDRWVDSNNRSFVEDNINLYDYLTDNGYYIPMVGSDISGGRVSDSFNLMPSWIRDIIKIDNESIKEADYKCLHPNLIMKIYGGLDKYITHKKISDITGIDVNIIKIEHLSFFNKRVSSMKKSVLWDYYYENHKNVIDLIIEDKNKNGYKVTSYRSFEIEVKIMTEVIIRLNKKDIFVGYVYDALFSKVSDIEEVKNIMNEVILENKIYTIAE